MMPAGGIRRELVASVEAAAVAADRAEGVASEDVELEVAGAAGGRAEEAMGCTATAEPAHGRGACHDRRTMGTRKHACCVVPFSRRVGRDEPRAAWLSLDVRVVSGSSTVGTRAALASCESVSTFCCFGRCSALRPVLGGFLDLLDADSMAGVSRRVKPPLVPPPCELSPVVADSGPHAPARGSVRCERSSLPPIGGTNRPWPCIP